MKKEKILETLKEHKSIIVNYGKGFISDKEIKEIAYYDNNIQQYRSETGIWSKKLLYEIFNNEVENMKLEIGE